jgi:molybdenum cofactor cytidylyltransferase
MSTDERVAGVVLAAGGSRRFGSPKQLADLDGRPLLGHAIAALRACSAAIDPRVVVLGNAADAIEDAIDLSRLTVVRCRDWSDGMSASLRAAIAAVGECDAAAVWLGDQPAITAAAIERVVAARDPPSFAIVRATYAGRPGHPVVFERRVFSALGSLRGDQGAKVVVAAHQARLVECADVASDDDVDTEAALRSARWSGDRG